MQKRFYVVVPLDDLPIKSSLRPGLLTQFFSWVGVDDTSAKAAARYRSFPDKSTQLKDRVQQVQASLHNVGLNSNRLTTQELIELYYQIFNPKTSQEQKIGNNEMEAAKMTL